MHAPLTPTERKSAGVRWIEAHFETPEGKATIARERRLREAQSQVNGCTSYPACDTFSAAGRP